MMQDPFAHSEEFDWQAWLEGLDLDRPLSELIDDPAWLEGMTFSQYELTHLEELGREYAQELVDREMLPEVPSMDMPEPLPVQEQVQELNHDLDVDH